jgi:hypothetical protein
MPRLRLVLPIAVLLAYSVPIVAEDATPPPTIQDFEAKKKMTEIDGLFPLAWDPATGHLYLKIRQLDQDFLFVTTLPFGLGANYINNPGFVLDRGAPGETKLVHFTRAGLKILLIQPNLSYRSSSANPHERLSIKESFAESVLAGFKVEAQENGTVLIDVSSFFITDTFGVSKQLANKKDPYKIEPDRSAIVPEDTKNFPLNTEVESLLTFTTEKPADDSLAATVIPDAYAFTVREHYSLIKLPDENYQPRAFDPRSGYSDLSYWDYSAPLGSPLDRHFVQRHRLVKKDPTAAISETTTPIVYYVDNGAPEPIRSALVEGASWWSQAFEAAGFKNAFRVEVLPDGYDPMDLRYNVIEWVHRSTRGWSYGSSIADPRTGEIIKGRVILDSLRGRQDYLIAEALTSPYKTGSAVPSALREMVLARIRQLAAHEVGHTLGLMHNFVASSIAPGTSVMDYPHPWITLDAGGHPDLSHAYATGIGAWDKVAIQYGYSQFAPGTDEHAALNAILSKAQASGLYLISDGDSRAPGTAHPYSHLWDNGSDPAAELDRILQVRAAALAQFGENAIPMGVPMAQIEDTLVPLYLYHRYQTAAAAKEIGGLNYRYALRGDGQMVTQIVSPTDQRKALDAVLQTISPGALTLPESLLRIMPPRPPGYSATQESFVAHTGVTFDPGAAAEAAAEITMSLLLNPERASRLVVYHARDPQNPGLQEVIEATLSATWKAPRAGGLQATVQGITETAAAEHLLSLAADSAASPEAQAIARIEAASLREWIAGANAATVEEKALHAATLARIDLFLREPNKFKPATPPPVPPGQPIGEDE